MKGINVEQVRQRAQEIRESIVKVRRYAAQPDEEFFADERNLYSVMHLLLLAIEATAGICNHLLAKVAHKAPDSYTDCFIGLEELGVLERPLARRLVQAGRFRNLLVHRYWEVDPRRVLAYARENLGGSTAKVTLIVDRHSERSEESPYYLGRDPSLRSG